MPEYADYNWIKSGVGEHAVDTEPTNLSAYKAGVAVGIFFAFSRATGVHPEEIAAIAKQTFEEWEESHDERFKEEE